MTEDDRQRLIVTTEKSLTDLKTKRQRALKDWQSEWSNYQTQMRLLQLDVDAANATQDAATKIRDRVKELVEHLAVPASELEEAVTEHRTASARLERAKQIHALYQEIATNEKELLPPDPKNPADGTETLQTH